MTRTRQALIFCLAVATAACSNLATAPAGPVQSVHAATASRGMVVSRSPLAADVGCDILRRGGNAVDAAIATAFAMAVTWPAAGNIGGGGFMLIHQGNGEPAVCVDYREIAPALAGRTTFQNDKNALSHRAAGVPGTVAGLHLAAERFATMPWRELVLPAARLAEHGFAVDEGLARNLNHALSNYQGNAEFRRLFGRSADAPASWQAGDHLVQQDLGKVLHDIAKLGPKGFYSGRTADLLEAEMLRGDGLIRKSDLAAYRAKLRPAIRCDYRGFEVWGAPPPSSGGICNTLMLQMLEPMNLRQRDRMATDTIHLIAETMRRAFAERARYLGDPDFAKIPAHLTSRQHSEKLRTSISFAAATRSQDLTPEIQITKESDSTTHFSVIDKNGMAVSNTYTLEHNYGSRIAVTGAGFILNNEMGDFNWQPGVTNRRGRIGTEANTVAPGKRMLSSMSPTIVCKNGKPFLVVGSPGGRTIINTVLCTLVNVLEFDMDLKTAIELPRLHHQWLPDRLYLEGAKTSHPELRKQLRALGHKVWSRKVQGDVNAIRVLPDGSYRGVADPRHLGKAAGY